MSALYDRNAECPICGITFSSKKIKRSGILLDKRDSDYCAYYKGDNPMFYSVFVCPGCGFASFESEFKEIKDLSYRFKDNFRAKVTSSWRGQSFGDERGVKEAMETYKLALITYTALSYKTSVVAKICLRIAWLYRYQGNNEKEMAFIKHARDKFIDAYQNENLSDDKENELLTMLLVGELSRRLSDYHTAVKWFSKLLQEPDIKKKRHIEMHARDLWAEASMAYKKEKGKDYEVDEE